MGLRVLRLISDGFIDPRFPFYEGFSSVFKSGRFIIKSKSGLEMTLKPAQSEVAFIKEGDEVSISMSASGYFFAALLEDIQNHESELKAAREVETEQRRQTLNKWRAQALLVNERLHRELPFEWRAAMKDVLSGLSPSSVGDGRNRRTVDHIFLLEEFKRGRLHRKGKEYLCTGSDTGKNWSDQRDSLSIDGDGMSYEAEITCKSCLRIAEKIIKSAPRNE